MPVFKYNGISALTLDERITTPSIHIKKEDDHWYVPLIKGDKDSIVRIVDYKYTLGEFKVGDLRAAIAREEMANVSSVTHVIQSYMGYETWVLTEDDELFGCGSGWAGQQGNGKFGEEATVLIFTKRAENVRKVLCAENVVWYIDNNNNLYGCGDNQFGNQGSGDTENVSVFTKRAENVKEVFSSGYTTWYLTYDNELYGCGCGSGGCQGSGDTNDVLTFTKRAENVKEVSCSYETTWYIDFDNNLYGCGSNYYKQHGTGSKDRTSEITTFTKRAENVKQVSCSASTTWYIDNNDNLYGCGDNNCGQQGLGNISFRVDTFTKRAENVKEVKCDNTVTWYLTNDGELYGCGINEAGAQGNGEVDSNNGVKTFTKRAENVKDFSCTQSTTWYLTNDGELYGCGINYVGNQGTENVDETFPVVPTFTKRAENVKDFNCGENASWYIDFDNNLYGCGLNYGNQGNGEYGMDKNVFAFTKR